MTWTRLDDGWTDKAALAELSFPDRWHYLALIQHCSRTDKLDGVVRGVDARRCSDHPDPASALANLHELELIEVLDKDRYRVAAIDEHVPPPSVRKNAEASKQRMRRKRAHDGGDHSLCKPEAECVTVTPGVTRNVGTGRDGPGREASSNSTWDAVPLPTDPGSHCDVCSALINTDSTSTICGAMDEMHAVVRRPRAV